MKTWVAGRCAIAQFSVNRCQQTSLTIVRQNAHVRAIPIFESEPIGEIGKRRLYFWRKSGIFCDSCQPVILTAGCKNVKKISYLHPNGWRCFYLAINSRSETAGPNPC